MDSRLTMNKTTGNPMGFYMLRPKIKNGKFVRKYKLRPSDFVFKKSLEELQNDPKFIDRLMAECNQKDNKVNMIGKKFGSLEVVQLSDNIHMNWICYCADCHTKIELNKSQLTPDRTCGCKNYRNHRYANKIQE